MDKNDPRPVLLGVVAAAHGVRGQVRIRSYTADPLDIGSYGDLYDSKGRRFALSRLALAKGAVVASLSGINDRNAAEALRGTELFVDRSQLPDDELDEDEFFIEDLVGLEVRDETGAVTGSVASVQNFGADDVLEVQAHDGGRHYYPFTKAVVPVIALEDGHIVIVPPGEITVAPEGSNERLADPDAAEDGETQ